LILLCKYSFISSFASTIIIGILINTCSIVDFLLLFLKHDTSEDEQPTTTKPSRVSSPDALNQITEENDTGKPSGTIDILSLCLVTMAVIGYLIVYFFLIL
jgi:hypothetical protein